MDVYYSDKVYNLMLIGVDRRDKSWNGNSDTMILISINYDKQKVTMTSFMRDTWVNIPGVGMRKMNAAFAIGTIDEIELPRIARNLDSDTCSA